MLAPNAIAACFPELTRNTSLKEHHAYHARESPPRESREGIQLFERKVGS